MCPQQGVTFLSVSIPIQTERDGATEKREVDRQRQRQGQTVRQS